MINSKLKQMLAVAIVAQGVYMTSKALMKSFEVSGKIAKENKINTPLDEEGRYYVLNNKTHEINHVFQKIKPIFENGNKLIDEDMLLTLNKTNIVPFETESENWIEEIIDVSYPEKTKKKAFYKIIFSPLTDYHTDITLRLHMEDWEGYVDVLLYRCISKAIINENYLQIVHKNDILIDALIEDDFIVLQRISQKTEGRGNSFVIKNKVSGQGFISKNYHNI